MKGDFSRLTFDPRKHYRSVRMQQGRVQLDADWNEQADIFDYLQRTHCMAVMGDHGVPAAWPDAFAILVDQPEEAEQGEAGAVQPGSQEVSQPGAQEPAAPGPPGEAAAPPSKDFWIGAGHCYVDGILCENDSKVAFIEQPDYPAGAAQAMLESLSPGQRYMAYLDVWQRHISAHQDPALQEVGLGGPDTTSRAKTVWQVKLLPVEQEDEWENHLQREALKGQLRARRLPSGPTLDNQLYRVEIHTLDEKNQVTFKWSRENGSVVFPIREEYLDTREDLAGDDKETIDTGSIELNLEGLDRDPYQLSENDWVEIVDDVTVLKGCSLPLCQVKELDRPHGKITLQVDKESIERILAEIGERELQHPLLRRWDQKEPNNPNDEEADDSNWENGVIRVEKGTWQALEHSIEVCFTGQGPNQPGDYWLIPARTAGADGGIQWPAEEDGQPQAQLPHGISHHYAPLAQLKWTEAGWIVEEDRRLIYSPLTALTDARDNLQAGIQELETRLKSIIDQLADGIDRALELAVNKGGMFHDYPSAEPLEEGAEPLEEGDVVALDVDRPDHIRRASTQNAALVLGVVTQDLGEQTLGEKTYRIALYGQAKCKVQGQVKPGDLLVPSRNAGCATRGELYIQPGTLIGKALEASQSDETSRIKILVTLG